MDNAESATEEVIAEITVHHIQGGETVIRVPLVDDMQDDPEVPTYANVVGRVNDAFLDGQEAFIQLPSLGDDGVPILHFVAMRDVSRASVRVEGVDDHAISTD